MSIGSNSSSLAFPVESSCFFTVKNTIKGYLLHRKKIFLFKNKPTNLHFYANCCNTSSIRHRWSEKNKVLPRKCACDIRHAQSSNSNAYSRVCHACFYPFTMKSVFRSGLFEGKVAIVTGGGTGIGKAIARELLYLGSKVVISSRKAERLQKAADELRRYVQPTSSAEVKVVPCNIREEQQVKRIIRSTVPWGIS